jgi:molybdopterin-guanine dinucleotide biosynthesis protein A
VSKADKAAAVAAIFVGGQSKRMGGVPKGLLRAPGTDEALVDRLVRIAGEARLAPVLLGDARAYVHVAQGVPRIDDDPSGIGPLGGLRAAFAHADGRAVIALACDMPFVEATHLGTLLGARSLADPTDVVDVFAARRSVDAPLEPFLARYDSTRCLPILDGALAAGERSFQAFFARARVLPVTIEEGAFRDWDAPADVGSRAPG